MGEAHRYPPRLHSVNASEAANVMQPFPKISLEARKVLEIIVGNTALDGSTLMRHMGASSPSEIIPSLRELQTHQLIEVGGNLTDDGLPFARFGVRPSAKEYMYSLLKQAQA